MRQLFVTWTIVLYLMVVFCSTGHSQTTQFYFIHSNLGSLYIIDRTVQLTIPYTHQHNLTTSVTHPFEQKGSKGFYVSYCSTWRAPEEPILPVH